MTNLPTEYLTPTEKQAQKLWATFDSQQQESFWKKYNVLLRDCLATQQKPEKVSLPSSASKTKASEKQTFHPDGAFITGKIFNVLPPLAVIMILLVQNFPTKLTIEVIGIFMLVFISITITWLFILSNVSSFEVNDQQLVILHPFIFSRKVIKWKRIHSITIEKEHDGSEHPESFIYNLLIKLDTGFQYSNPYKLGTNSHRAFFGALSQRVAILDNGGYLGYNQ